MSVHNKYISDLLKRTSYLSPYYGGFQSEFVSISRIINHMTSYKTSALIGWNYNIQTGEKNV